MNKLIVIVGPSGVGKTTLAHALCEEHDFAIAYEQHNERPFQTLFKQDSKYALANQLDYLLFRAEQEHELRKGEKPALMDGGLDLAAMRSAMQRAGADPQRHGRWGASFHGFRVQAQRQGPARGFAAFTEVSLSVSLGQAVVARCRVTTNYAEAMEPNAWAMVI